MSARRKRPRGPRIVRRLLSPLAFAKRVGVGKTQVFDAIARGELPVTLIEVDGPRPSYAIDPREAETFSAGTRGKLRPS